MIISRLNFRPMSDRAAIVRREGDKNEFRDEFFQDAFDRFGIITGQSVQLRPAQRKLCGRMASRHPSILRRMTSFGHVSVRSGVSRRGRTVNRIYNRLDLLAQNEAGKSS